MNTPWRSDDYPASWEGRVNMRMRQWRSRTSSTYPRQRKRAHHVPRPQRVTSNDDNDIHVYANGVGAEGLLALAEERNASKRRAGQGQARTSEKSPRVSEKAWRASKCSYGKLEIPRKCTSRTTSHQRLLGCVHMVPRCCILSERRSALRVVSKCQFQAPSLKRCQMTKVNRSFL